MNDNEIKSNVKKEDVQLDDIFADENDVSADTVVDVNVSKSSLIKQANTGPIQTIDYENEGLGILGKIKKHLFKIVILIIAILLIGGGFVYRQQLSTFSSHYASVIVAKISLLKRGETVKEKVEEQTENNLLPAGNNESVSQVQNNAAVTQSPEKVDSDYDGLIDSEEKFLGTNPNSVDSDSDGLFDREEVKVYKTNPLSQDTDDDGYKDGDEVKAKMNPRGPGALNEMK